MYSDMGSPYQIPLEGLKKLVLVPLTKMAIEWVQMQDVMILIIFVENLNYWRLRLTKDHYSLSKSSLGQFS